MGLLTRRYLILIRRLAGYWFSYQLRVDRPVPESGPALIHIYMGLRKAAGRSVKGAACEALSHWRRGDHAGSSFYRFDDYARGGRAGHHRVVSDHRIRHPAERIRVRHLSAPPLTTMQTWTASPYDGVGVYIGGVNRSCSQPISPLAG